MIITKQHAQKLMRQGKAEIAGIVTQDGRKYVTVVRYDVQRHDHYEATRGDLRGILGCHAGEGMKR